MERLVIGTGVMASLLAVACSSGIDVEEASAAVENYFRTYETRDVEGILALYSDQYYEQLPRKKRIRLLELQYELLGSIKSWNIVDWRTDKKLGLGGYQMSATIQYELNYEKSSSVENFTIIRTAGGEIRILGHHIHSDAFAELARQPEAPARRIDE
jgi:hypothetical protein